MATNRAMTDRTKSAPKKPATPSVTRKPGPSLPSPTSKVPGALTARKGGTSLPSPVQKPSGARAAKKGGTRIPSPNTR